IFQPEWDREGVLHFSSDASGWWNLYRLESDGSATALTELRDGEIGAPSWVFGMRRFVFLGDGRIACVVTRGATDSLELLDPRSGRLEPLELEWTEFAAGSFAAAGGVVAFAAASPRTPRTLVLLDLATGELESVRRSLDGA